MPKKSDETTQLIGGVDKDAKAASAVTSTVEKDKDAIMKDIEMGQKVYGEYCPTDDYCDNTIKLPGTLYQNFLAPPINWVYETAYGILCPPLEDVKPSSPADIFKKFVFSLVKLFQVYMVLEIMQGVSIPDEAPTTGQFTYYIPYAIGGSFLLQFLDFSLSMFPKTGFHQIVCTFQTMLTTFILNLLTTPNWGAKGEYVSILQEVVKNQALINTLDFGLINALFPLPNCFAIALDAIDTLFQSIYDTVIKPVVDFFVFLFNWIMDWIILPPYNFIILAITTICGWIADACVAIWGFITYIVTSIAGGIAWCCGATGDEITWCCGVVGDCCGSIGSSIGDCCSAIGSFLYSIFTCSCVNCDNCGNCGNCDNCGNCGNCDNCGNCGNCDNCNWFCISRKKTVKLSTNRVAEISVCKNSQGQYIEKVDFTYTDDSKDSASSHGSSNNVPQTMVLKPSEFIKKVTIFESKSNGVTGIHVTTNLSNSLFGTKGMDNEIYEYTCKKSEVGIVDIKFKTVAGVSGSVGFLKNIIVNKEKKKPDGTIEAFKEEMTLQPIVTKIDKANCLASCGI